VILSIPSTRLGYGNVCRQAPLSPIYPKRHTLCFAGIMSEPRPLLPLCRLEELGLQCDAVGITCYRTVM
jgi:hypothetical protein